MSFDPGTTGLPATSIPLILLIAPALMLIGFTATQVAAQAEAAAATTAATTATTCRPARPPVRLTHQFRERASERSS